MFGTDDIFFRSVNPDHRTVSKTATQLVCNSHQSVMEPLQLKIRSSKLCLSRPLPPVLRRLLHRSNPGADLWLLSLALHGVHMHHHCSLGRDQMSPTPGPTAVPCQAQPSRQPVVTRSGRVVRPNPKYFDT